MRRDQKKHLKQKKREKELAERRKAAEAKALAQRRRDRYPPILVDPAGGDPDFVEIVREALKDVRFDDTEVFPEVHRKFYRDMSEVGYPIALSRLKGLFEDADDSDSGLRDVGPTVVLMGLGTALLIRIPEEIRRRFMPFNDVFVEPRGKEIVLTFSSLMSERGEGGRIFFSRRRPQVEFDGKQWTVAFSRHAIEQICSRVNPRYLEYAAAGDIHALFANCVYVEPAVLRDGQPAFLFYDQCAVRGFLQYSTYVESILGKENVHPTKGKCYYKLGYCPVVFEKGFAKAKTFLYPGYSKTPEYELVLRSRSRLSKEEHELLIRQSTTQDATDVILNDNHQAIKWYHDHGIPQVVQMTRQVFVPYGE